MDDLLDKLERDRHREREQRIKAGLDTKDIDAEYEEDFMGVTPLIEKLEKKEKKDMGYMVGEDEPSDSDSDDDVDTEAVEKSFEMFERKCKRHEELIQNFTDAGI